MAGVTQACLRSRGRELMAATARLGGQGSIPPNEALMWFAYALQSDKDGGLYVGMTSDVGKRVKEHNSGYSQSTRSRVPFTLIYFEECGSRSEARERERYLKSGKGRDLLKSRMRRVL